MLSRVSFLRQVMRSASTSTSLTTKYKLPTSTTPASRTVSGHTRRKNETISSSTVATTQTSYKLNNTSNSQFCTLSTTPKTSTATSSTAVATESSHSVDKASTPTPTSTPESVVSSGSENLIISERCVRRLQKLQSQRNTNIVLRVAVDGGGCSGFQYNFDLESWDDEQIKTEALKTEDDILFHKDGIHIMTDKISLAYISGSTLDYVEEMISSSFRIMDNPNSESSCGCGVSFSPKL